MEGALIVEFDFPEPLRLAVGSHQAGSGMGCAMNVVSWENGDFSITDLPDCADRSLAHMVQYVNDNYCLHTTKDASENSLLCPRCSVDVLALAHRTPGTGGNWWRSREDRSQKLYWIFSTVVRRNNWDTIPVVPVLDVIDKYYAGRVLAADLRHFHPVSPRQDSRVFHQSYLLAESLLRMVIDDANADHFQYVFRSLVDMPLTHFPVSPQLLLSTAHQVIDAFEEVTGVRGQTPDADTITAAVCRMQGVTTNA
jgi:hypothetical protein